MEADDSETCEIVKVECKECGSTYEGAFFATHTETIKNNKTICLFCDSLILVPPGVLPSMELIGPPRDLQMDIFARIDLDEKEFLEKIHHQEILQVAKAFASNMWRMNSIIKMPPALSAASALTQAMMDEVAIEMFGTLKRKPHSDEEAEDYLTRVRSKMGKWTSENGDDAFLSLGMDHVKMRQQFRRIWPALDALVRSQIPSAWTAFEVVAGDLWEAAINLHPQTLAMLSSEKIHKKREVQKKGKVSAQEREKLDSSESKTTDEDSEKRGSVVKIDLTMLHRMRYEISDKMGTILREEMKFDSLGGIRIAYDAAFPAEKIYAILRDKSLTRLNAIRNATVHKAGIVDKKFVDRMKDDEEFGGLKIGDKVVVNGSLIASVVMPAMDACVELILTVDQWIKDNPSRS